ncbi:MAG TPA: hypothetical protein DIT76_09490, partial [Spartobacteria bacterium]|nr:hypothetical protein [Spartobacteria bacterium]
MRCAARRERRKKFQRRTLLSKSSFAKLMDSTQNRCSILSMWKSFAALLLLVTPVLAQEHATAYEALRVVGTQLNRDFVNHVISV